MPVRMVQSAGAVRDVSEESAGRTVSFCCFRGFHSLLVLEVLVVATEKGMHNKQRSLLINSIKYQPRVGRGGR